MKLSKSADISASSKIRIICLPENKSGPIFQKNNMKVSQYYSRPKQNMKPQLKYENKSKINADSSFKYLEKISNVTKNILNNMLLNKQKNLKYNIRVAINETNDNRMNGDHASNVRYDKKENGSGNIPRSSAFINNIFVSINESDDENISEETEQKKETRSNAKKLHFGSDSLYMTDLLNDNSNHLDDINECFVTGWGRSQTNGSLTDTLLEASVPPLPIEACMGKYPENLPLQAGHLCAGNTDGSTGTCVVRNFILISNNKNCIVSSILNFNICFTGRFWRAFAMLWR